MTTDRRSNTFAIIRGALAVLALGGLLFAAVPLDSAAAAERMIGRAGAVRNKVEGVIGGTPRPMAAKDALVLDQGVRTGVDSTAQLLFLDETSMNVGPNSDVRLDKFLYNPDRAQNDIVLTATKGIFRFVSGSSDPRSYHLKTPVATIGVRGTIYDTIVTADADIIILVEGRLVITLTNGQEVVLDKVGQALRIDKGGHVEGPITWDGTLYNVTGVVPYPLFGNSFLPADERHTPELMRTETVNTINAADIIRQRGRCSGECG